jgi:hypothetical protein
VTSCQAEIISSINLFASSLQNVDDSNNESTTPGTECNNCESIDKENIDSCNANDTLEMSRDDSSLTAVLPSVSKFGNWGHSKTISKYNETCLKQTLNITASCLNRTQIVPNYKFKLLCLVCIFLTQVFIMWFQAKCNDTVKPV